MKIYKRNIIISIISVICLILAIIGLILRFLSIIYLPKVWDQIGHLMLFIFGFSGGSILLFIKDKKKSNDINN